MLTTSQAKQKSLRTMQEEEASLRRRTSKFNPRVFFDIEINGKAMGRIEFVLYMNEAPRAAENFRALCTGEKGTVPPGHEGAGGLYHFKGKHFYRIIDQFIDQAGAGTDSVFGGRFKDDPGGLKLKHDRKGLLSMANSGPDTNTSHFRC
jgi:peptidyl-prolyl isomerase D